MLACARTVVGGRLMNSAEQKGTAAALRESEERFRAVFENALDGILVADARWAKFHAANPAMCQMLGYAEQELQTMWLRDIHPKADLPDVVNTFDRLLHSRGGVATDIRMQHKDGGVLETEVSAFVITVGGKDYLAGMFRDVTARKRAEAHVQAYEQELRSLVAELALSEERERRRLATELHDTLGQALALARLNVSEAQSTDDPESAAECLGEALRLLRQVIDDTRAIMMELSPPELYSAGLAPAVAKLVDEMGKRHNLALAFADDGALKPMGDDVRVLLYRATRELLLNIVKHADARSARVEMRRVGDEVVVTVEDDGVGFDAADKCHGRNDGTHFGLPSIRERLRHAGGSLELGSQRDTGTRAALRMPLTTDQSRSQYREG